MLKKITAVILIACMAVLFAACSKGSDEPEPAGSASAFVSSSYYYETVPADYTDYTGYQFSGTDPWEGSLAITIRSIEDGKMAWTFTDVYEENILYAEMTDTPIEGYTATFDIQGADVANENLTFHYQGFIDLADGTLIVTFQSGAVTSESAEGGYSARIADALVDSGLSNQVELTKVVDPS